MADDDEQQAPGGDSPGGDEAAGTTRDALREQMIASVGGWSGTAMTAIPPVVFVVVNATAGLEPAVIAAIGSAVLLTIYRLARHQPVQQALTGLFAVVVAAIIAARTGQARGYFLLGIWASFAYAAVFAGSIVVRRPLVGVAWEFFEPTPGGEAGSGHVAWRSNGPLRRAYMYATLGATAVFLARGVVQLALFAQNSTGWLAFARIAMGYPLTIAAVGFGFWVVTRARKKPTVGQALPAAGQQPSGAD